MLFLHASKSKKNDDKVIPVNIFIIVSFCTIYLKTLNKLIIKMDLYEIIKFTLNINFNLILIIKVFIQTNKLTI